MSDTDYLDSAPRKRRWPWALLAVGILLVCALCGYREYLANKIQARLAAIRSAGLPATSFELDRWYVNVPLDENAALRILEAADARSNNWVKIDGLDGPNRSEPLTMAQQEKYKLILSDNSRALKILHQAAQLPKSRYPVDWTPGPGALLPHLTKIRELTQLLGIEGALASENDHLEQGVQALKDAVMIARSLDDEPALVSQMVRIACLQIASTSLERMLSRNELRNDQLEELSGVFHEAEARNPEAFERALIGERCLGTYVFQLPVSRLSQCLDQNSTDGQILRYQVLDLIGVRDRDFLFYLQVMAEWKAICRLPFPDCLVKARDANRQFEARIKQHGFYMLSSMLLPALQGVMEKAAESTARLRCVQSALAVERFRLKNKANLPATLDELVPSFLSQIPIDPCDGNPLRYKRLTKGFVIYSLGKDGTDQGGAELSKKPKNTTLYDVTFVVER